jgi:Tfp pilus assembly protein FimT
MLELVMVMMLLCVVAAMATPSLRGFSEGRKVGSCAAQVVSVAHWARTQAVTRGVAFRLNVNPADNTFWLTCEQAGVFVTPGEEFGRVFAAPEGVTLRWHGPWPTLGSGTQYPYVEFQPTGRTTTAASIEIADERGSVVEVATRSPGEPVRALADWERAAR